MIGCHHRKAANPNTPLKYRISGYFGYCALLITSFWYIAYAEGGGLQAYGTARLWIDLRCSPKDEVGEREQIQE
jgi:hypothetical protein